MNDFLNAAIAAVVLAGLILKLAHGTPDQAHRFASVARAAAHAAVGYGLLAVVVAPLTGQDDDRARTAMLVGIAALILVRWPRKPENTK